MHRCPCPIQPTRKSPCSPLTTTEPPCAPQSRASTNAPTLLRAVLPAWAGAADTDCTAHSSACGNGIHPSQAGNTPRTTGTTSLCQPHPGPQAPTLAGTQRQQAWGSGGSACGPALLVGLGRHRHPQRPEEHRDPLRLRHPHGSTVPGSSPSPAACPAVGGASQDCSTLPCFAARVVRGGSERAGSCQVQGRSAGGSAPDGQHGWAQAPEPPHPSCPGGAGFVGPCLHGGAALPPAGPHEGPWGCCPVPQPPRCLPWLWEPQEQGSAPCARPAHPAQPHMEPAHIPGPHPDPAKPMARHRDRMPLGLEAVAYWGQQLTGQLLVALVMPGSMSACQPCS